MLNNTEIRRDTVLVVDDTPANHDIIKTFLNDINVNCESAFNGMEALTMCDTADKDHYALILMDLNMPHMNGAETLVKLHDMGIKAPVVAVTAADKSDSRLDETRTNFDAILFKPFNSSEFYSAISPYIKNATQYSLSAVKVSEAAVSKKETANEIDPSVCDIEKGISNMGGSQRLFTKHFKNFVRNNVDLEIRMRSLLSSGNYRDCYVLCHSLKGLSGMLGLTNLHKHLTELEPLLGDHSPIEADAIRIPKEILELVTIVGDDMLLICKVQF